MHIKLPPIAFQNPIAKYRYVTVTSALMAPYLMGITSAKGWPLHSSLTSNYKAD